MSTGTGARARLWPKPVVGQTWIDADGDDVTIIEVRPEGDYPVSFTQKGGSTGACARDMEDMKPTDETWLAHLLSADAELRRIEGERDEARRDQAHAMALALERGSAHEEAVCDNINLRCQLVDLEARASFAEAHEREYRAVSLDMEQRWKEAEVRAEHWCAKQFDAREERDEANRRFGETAARPDVAPAWEKGE